MQCDGSAGVDILILDGGTGVDRDEAGEVGCPASLRIEIFNPRTKTCPLGHRTGAPGMCMDMEIWIQSKYMH